mmetsp:Transcript_51134/g.91379  ORF Transcript_51134/g.91379 Transcript_51134/m.91379 type:complete len:234 (-) Transcript_51134:265-966(-)
MGSEASIQAVPQSDQPPTPTSKPLADVYLNVYNIAEPGLLQSIGLGLFHSGVEVYGREWSYGGTAEHVSGVFWLPPRTAVPDFKECIKLGQTHLNREEVAHMIEELKLIWIGSQYNVLSRNCNHFSHEFAARLGFEVPEWVNRAARVGDKLLPDSWVEFVMEKCLPNDLPSDENTDNMPMIASIPENLEVLSVRELKTIMFLNNITWDQCVEKEELVARIQQYRDHYRASNGW